MSLVDALKKSGFKPEKSSEGEFQPYQGIYGVDFVKVDKVKSDRTQTDQLRCEFKIAEALFGKESASKFNEFKKYVALEGDEATDKKKGIPYIINALFTAGYEVSGDTDEAMMESIQGALGTRMYLRAWGWKPEDAEKAIQQFSFMKEEAAQKRAKAEQKKAGTSF